MASCSIADEELLVNPSKTTAIIMKALETFTGQQQRMPFHRLADTGPIASSSRLRQGIR
jgi:hypothetical protein